jgi:DNA-binding response OmpR family regulator
MYRIAIIEEDETICFLLREVLTVEGYEPILIDGPRDLLAQLSAVTPHLVLLDFVLSAWGDRLALATGIRRDPQLVQVPLVVMSAAPDVLRRHQGALLDLRCRLIEKPFDLGDLLAVIQGELLDRQDTRN